MTKKIISVLTTLLLLGAVFSACSGGAASSSQPEPVSRIYGVYADLESVSKTGCRLRVSGDSSWEISNVFSIYDISGSSEYLVEPGPDRSQIQGFTISESGVTMNYNWANLCGALPRGQYRIQFTLLQGGGSVSFTRDFRIQ